MSRFRESLAKLIAARRMEIDLEWHRGLAENELLGPDETGESFMATIRRELQELIYGRALWLDHEDGIAWHDARHGYQNLGLEINEEEVAMIMTEEFVRKLDHVSDRLKDLPTITLQRIPSDGVRSALDQATQCYLHGLFAPSATLCRVTLEAVLSDHGVKPSILEKMIQIARENEVFDGRQAESAHRIRLLGNDAAHGRRVDQQRAREALWDLKALLQELYGV
jgi:hypothetical protein